MGIVFTVALRRINRDGNERTCGAAVAYVLVALGGNFIASGAVNFAFVPLIAIPSAVALVAYALASAGVSFLAVRNSQSPQNAGTQEI